MPSYKGKSKGDYGKKIQGCGFYIQFTHLSSGAKANFVGEVTDFKDVYTSKWEEKPVYGRMDPISTFQRTGRKISISWKIINEDALTGAANMIEIQKLIHFLYPDYYSEGNNASTISGGPVLRLKFANLSNTRKSGPGLVGYLDGFTFDPDFNSSFIEAGKDSIISTVINASINFTVLHTRKLGWTVKKRRGGVFPYGYTDGELNTREEETKRVVAAVLDSNSSTTQPSIPGEEREGDVAPDSALEGAMSLAKAKVQRAQRAGQGQQLLDTAASLYQGIENLFGTAVGQSAAGDQSRQQKKSANSEAADLGVDGTEHKIRPRYIKTDKQINKWQEELPESE